MSYHIGIDLGGTTITGGIYTTDYAPIATKTIPTYGSDESDTVVSRIAALAKALMSAVPKSNIDAVGLTVPGLFSGEKGPVIFAPNVGWKDTNPVPFLEQSLGMPVSLFHDAACAAAAEAKFGYGQQYRSFLFLTLGTAIGASFIWNGVPFDQHGPFGSELGHIPLRGDGIPCSCGLPGCFQQYGSAVALARQAVEALYSQPSSCLWDLCDGDLHNMTSATVFEAAKMGDSVAINVIDTFISYLAEGIGGLVNVFRPEAIIIGGGLSNAGERLTQPMACKLKQYTHASERIGAPPVHIAQLGDGAGCLGAALLSDQRSE